MYFLAIETTVGRTIIHDNTFIGMDSVIMPGVKIGPNAIIGANSVVTKSIPPNSVAAGCPTKVISTLDEYVNEHMKLYDNDHYCIVIESPLLPMSNLDVIEFRKYVETIQDIIK